MNQPGRVLANYNNGSKTLRLVAAELSEEVAYILENSITKEQIKSIAGTAARRQRRYGVPGEAKRRVDLSSLRDGIHIETLHLKGNPVNSKTLATMLHLCTLSIDNHSGTNPARCNMIPFLRKLWIQKDDKNILGKPDCEGPQELRLGNCSLKRGNQRELRRVQNHTAIGTDSEKNRYVREDGVTFLAEELKSLLFENAAGYFSIRELCQIGKTCWSMG